MGTRAKTTAKIFFILAATTLSWVNIAAAAVFICSTILVALAGKLGSLVEVSFGPLKAKLEKNVSEAEEILENLRKLATTQGKAILDAAATGSRFASPNSRNFHTMKSIDSHLIQIGVNDDERRKVRSLLVDFTILDTGRAAISINHAPNHLGEAAVMEWRALINGMVSDPTEIELFLKKWNCLDERRSLLISDMRAMKRDRDIANEAQFVRSQSSFAWTDSDDQ